MLMQKRWQAMEESTIHLIHLATHSSDDELMAALGSIQASDLRTLATHTAKDGRTLLHTAAVKDRRGSLAKLLGLGLDVQVKDGHGLSPLYTCISHLVMTSAQILIQAGADVNETVCRNSHETILHKAVKADRIKAVMLLLESQTVMSCQTREGDTPLHYAARYNRQSIASILLDFRCDVNATNKKGQTALHLAIANKNMEVARMLIQKRCSVTIKDKLGQTALHAAVAANSLDLVRLMLSANSTHVNSKEPVLGRTPLLLACSHSNQKMASLLLSHGADANLTNNYRKSVLHVSASAGNNETMCAVIRSTSNLNALSTNNMTALHIAVTGRHTTVTKTLLKHGANANLRDIDGNSALHLAAQVGDDDMVSVLVHHGAHVNSTNMLQRTPLHLACMNGFQTTADILKENGADQTLLDSYDKRPEQYLAGTSRKEKILARQQKMRRLSSFSSLKEDAKSIRRVNFCTFSDEGSDSDENVERLNSSVVEDAISNNLVNGDDNVIEASDELKNLNHIQSDINPGVPPGGMQTAWADKEDEETEAIADASIDVVDKLADVTVDSDDVEDNDVDDDDNVVEPSESSLVEGDEPNLASGKLVTADTDTKTNSEKHKRKISAHRKEKHHSKGRKTSGSGKAVRKRSRGQRSSREETTSGSRQHTHGSECLRTRKDGVTCLE